jgi:GAF domain-containing protein
MTRSDSRSLTDAISGNPLRAILEVSAALVSSLEYGEVMAAVAEKIGQAMSVWNVGISSYDAVRDVCVFEGWWCEGGITQEDRDYIGTVADLRERPDLRHILDTPGVQVESVTDRFLPSLDREQLTKWGIKTEVDVRLTAGDEVIGMIGLEEHRFVREFTPVELDLFAKLCDLAAIGIHNAMVYRHQQERNRHLESLLEVSRELSAARGALFPTLAVAGAAAMQAPRSLVYEYDPASDMLICRGTHHEDSVSGYGEVGVAETIAEVLGDRALLTATTPLVEQVSDPALSADAREVLERWGETTCINAPLVYGDTPLGVLMIAWTGREHPITDAELTLAIGMAQQAAAAIENERLVTAGGPSPATMEPSA